MPLLAGIMAGDRLAASDIRPAYVLRRLADLLPDGV